MKQNEIKINSLNKKYNWINNINKEFLDRNNKLEKENIMLVKRFQAKEEEQREKGFIIESTWSEVEKCERNLCKGHWVRVELKISIMKQGKT